MKNIVPVTPQAVDRLITNDIETCNALFKLLTKEQEALKQRNIDELSQIIEEKTLYLEKLEKSAQQRAQWASHINNENVIEGWNKLLSHTNQPQLKESWYTLKHLLKECQYKNQVNGKVLARSQHIYSRLTEIMRGKATSPSLYNAIGESLGGGASHKVGEA